MSSYSERDTYSQAGDWLLGTVRRNPEAVLLLAASCCLLMRSPSRPGPRVARYRKEWEYDPALRGASSDVGRASASAREGLSRAAESTADAAEAAGDYASRMKDRAADTAKSYADSVAEFADDARRNVSERSARLTRQAQSTLQSTMTRILREQPLAVAAAGLAAGAAIAAIFPSTDIEDRALGGAHEKLRDAAEKAGARVVDAAGKAGERLKSAAEERGLTSEGLKDLAGEVANTFTDAVSGKSDDQRGGSGARENPSAASGSSQSFGNQNFGTDQSTRDPIRNSGGPPDPGGRSGR